MRFALVGFVVVEVGCVLLLNLSLIVAPWLALICFAIIENPAYYIYCFIHMLHVASDCEGLQLVLLAARQIHRGGTFTCRVVGVQFKVPTLMLAGVI
jgi:hypothetical protein